MAIKLNTLGMQSSSQKSSAVTRSTRRPHFWHQDAVTHTHRGRGTFGCYGADDSTCFVHFEDSGESEQVTTAHIKSLKRP